MQAERGLVSLLGLSKACVRNGDRVASFGQG